jgi:hypothetical protein
VFLISPEKLLVVLFVAMLVVGPDKLPKVARQIGALWRDLQRWRARLEGEARNIFPDLPPLDSISHAVRSPISFLDRLAAGDNPQAVDSIETPSVPAQSANLESKIRVDYFAPSTDDPSMN